MTGSRPADRARSAAEGSAEALIDRIYDAAVDPDFWDPALTAMADEMDSASCILVGHREGTWTAPRFGHFGRLDPEFNIKASREQFSDGPFVQSLAGAPDGRIISSDAILPLSEAQRTHWYRELMTPQDIAHVMMTTLLRDHGTFGVFFVTRSAASGPYCDVEIRRFAQLVPHLGRAMHIRCRLDAYRALAGNQQTLLDLIDTGVILIDEAGAARCANRAAEGTIAAGGGLQLRGSNVSAVDRRRDAELQRVIRATAAGGCGGMLALPRSDSDQPLLVLVCPVRGAIRQTLGRADGPRAAVALFIRDPAQESAAGLTDVLTQFYRLTPGEARVAKGLAAGPGVAGVASRLGLSQNTVKMHAKRVYDKLGVASQAELAQLCGRLATPVRADATRLAA